MLIYSAINNKKYHIVSNGQALCGKQLEKPQYYSDAHANKSDVKLCKKCKRANK